MNQEGDYNFGRRTSIPRCPAYLTEAYKLYQKEVIRLTRKVKKSTIEGFENKPDNWNIDHKISVMYGFLYKIPVDQISDISNLHVVSRKFNSFKRTACIFTGTKLPVHSESKRMWEFRMPETEPTI